MSFYFSRTIVLHHRPEEKFYIILNSEKRKRIILSSSDTRKTIFSRRFFIANRITLVSFAICYCRLENDNIIHSQGAGDLFICLFIGPIPILEH